MNILFERAFKFTMDEEGGYINDTNDPGGETKYGITKRDYPEEDIKNLTLDKAKEIALKNYWDLIDITGLPDTIKIMLFDMGYTCGVTTAKIYLQKAVGVAADGIIGEKTITAVNRLEGSALILLYGAWRRICYLIKINENPSLSIYQSGWFGRTKRLEEMLLA